jgi:hypothetical protein
MRTYVTFGSNHNHNINGQKLNRNRVAVLETPSAHEGRALAFELFKDKFAFEYPEKYWDKKEQSKWYGDDAYIYLNEKIK